jgi:hypothetical protein
MLRLLDPKRSRMAEGRMINSRLRRARDERELIRARTSEGRRTRRGKRQNPRADGPARLPSLPQPAAAQLSRTQPGQGQRRHSGILGGAQYGSSLTRTCRSACKDGEGKEENAKSGATSVRNASGELHNYKSLESSDRPSVL